MGWGNTASISHAERKRWAKERSDLLARIAQRDDLLDQLRASLAYWVATAYHPNACAIWRGEACSCGTGVPVTTQPVSTDGIRPHRAYTPSEVAQARSALYDRQVIPRRELIDSAERDGLLTATAAARLRERATEQRRLNDPCMSCGRSRDEAAPTGCLHKANHRSGLQRATEQQQ